MYYSHTIKDYMQIDEQTQHLGIFFSWDHLKYTKGNFFYIEQLFLNGISQS